MSKTSRAQRSKAAGVSSSGGGPSVGDCRRSGADEELECLCVVPASSGLAALRGGSLAEADTSRRWCQLADHRHGGGGTLVRNVESPTVLDKR